MEKEKHSTDNCYLTYSDELQGGGYLICTYNHKAGEECLLNMDDEKYEEVFQQERNPK